MRPFDGHVFMLGAEALSNTIDFGDLVNLANDSTVGKGISNRIRNGGAYVQDEFTLLDRFHIVPGVRLDYHTVFGFALSPKLGISAKVNEKVRVRSSLGRAFRAPNHTELFMPPLPLKDNITLVSNPDLKPEYVWAADGGVDVFPIANIKLQWGVFYNNMRDLIGQGIKPEIYMENDSLKFAALVTHENISSAWSAGSEFEVEWRILSGFTVRSGYVFQQSRNESASEVAALFKRIFGSLSEVADTNIALDYIPAHKANISVSFTKSLYGIKFAISGDEIFVGTRTFQNFGQIKLDTTRTGRKELILNQRSEVIANPPLARMASYFRTDLLLRCDFNNHFWATVAFQNLLNAQYEENFSTLAPGRLTTIKLGVRF